MQDIIQKEHVFNHPIDLVWKAISEAEEISTWFIKANFKAEKGYKYTFSHTDESTGDCTDITGEVLEATPVYKLVYTWVVPGTGVDTTVSWQLEETTEGTKLLLEHSGISQYPGETAVKMFNSFSGGWDNCIVELSKFLEPVTNA